MTPEDVRICRELGRQRGHYDGVPGTLVGYRWDTQQMLLVVDRPAYVMTLPREFIDLNKGDTDGAD